MELEAEDNSADYSFDLFEPFDSGEDAPAAGGLRGLVIASASILLLLPVYVAIQLVAAGRGFIRWAGSAPSVRYGAQLKH